MESKMRKVFRVVNEGFEEIEFMDLKKGDLFSMFEPTGQAVTFKGSAKLEAMSDSYINEDGIGEVHMKNYNPEVLH